MKQTKESINKQIDILQKFILNNNKKLELEKRVAYTIMETLRWAILDTNGWEKPLDFALTTAKIIKAEIDLLTILIKYKFADKGTAESTADEIYNLFLAELESEVTK